MIIFDREIHFMVSTKWKLKKEIRLLPEFWSVGMFDKVGWLFWVIAIRNGEW